MAMERIITFLFILSAGTVASQDISNTQDVQICPDDWFDANSLGCFKFLRSEVNLNWVEAQLACELIGGYLAEPTTESQAQFLSELAILEGSFFEIRYWYIGLSDLGREGDWRWIHTDQALTAASWARNHPSNRPGNSKDCAVMAIKKDQVWWEDHDCLNPDIKHNSVAPVCQQDTTDSPTTTEQPETQTTTEQPETQTTTEQPETTTTTTTVLPACPDGWTEFDSSCYQFVDNGGVTWQEAEDDCVNKGARLTSVHSRKEEKFLRGLASGDSYWMGGYPSRWEETPYLDWSDGTEFDYDNVYGGNYIGCLYQDKDYVSDGWIKSDCARTSSTFNGLIYSICKM